MQLTEEDYVRQMLRTTEEQKARLFESDEYKAALKQKGPSQAAWNWQTREKEADRRNQ